MTRVQIVIANINSVAAFVGSRSHSGYLHVRLIHVLAIHQNFHRLRTGKTFRAEDVQTGDARIAAQNTGVKRIGGFTELYGDVGRAGTSVGARHDRIQSPRVAAIKRDIYWSQRASRGIGRESRSGNL